MYPEYVDVDPVLSVSSRVTYNPETLSTVRVADSEVLEEVVEPDDVGSVILSDKLYVNVLPTVAKGPEELAAA